ncbi:MAG: M42 family peptidase [Oscillospiraceae bacterium]
MLEKLCQINGISGDEKNVREFIKSQITGFCEMKIDNLGNLIAYKKGKNIPKKKILVAAHMDEVGMITTYIKDDGTLLIAPVGGVEAVVTIGRQVYVGAGKILGVIGAKAVHNLTPEEKDLPAEFSKLYVDIGAENRAEAEKFVALGDTIAFKSDFFCFGNGKIKGKAIDDRAGCAAMISMICGEIEYDTTFVFTVQEEIGTRGAKTAAFAENPDFAIVLETTTAADIPPVSGEKRVCSLGKGAVVSYMDRATIYDRELFTLAFETAKKNGIKCQTKTMVAGGNDSGAIHISRGGVRTIAISAPCRYLHSPSCVVQQSDLADCENLAKAMIKEIGEL